MVRGSVSEDVMLERVRRSGKGWLPEDPQGHSQHKGREDELSTLESPWLRRTMAREAREAAGAGGRGSWPAHGVPQQVFIQLSRTKSPVSI